MMSGSPQRYKETLYAVGMILLYAVGSTHSVWAGGNGSDRGGGGGVYKPADVGMISVGYGAEVLNPEPSSYEEELLSFQKDYPAVRVFAPCRSRPDLKLPGIIPDIEKLFTIWLEGRGGEPKRYAESDLCRAPRLLASYGRFRMLLAEARKDDFTLKLLRLTESKGGPIPIVITDHDFVLETQSGTRVVEPAIYDSASQRIFWHSKRQRERNTDLATMLVARKPHAFLRHEVMHVFLHRVLKDKHPDKLIHYGRRPEGFDCRACARKKTKHCQCKQIGDRASEYLDWVTNPGSALIEGLCDWAEGAYDGMSHPYHVGGQVLQGYWSKERVCFLNRGAPVRWDSLDSNEAHINSALRLLTSTFHREEKHIRQELSQPKTDALLESLATLDEFSIDALAAGFDRIRGQSEAAAWQRRYFGSDHSTGAQMRTSLETKADNGFYEHCLNVEESLRWFSKPLE
jgi:hypothetical protein